MSFIDKELGRTIGNPKSYSEGDNLALCGIYDDELFRCPSELNVCAGDLEVKHIKRSVSYDNNDYKRRPSCSYLADVHNVAFGSKPINANGINENGFSADDCEFRVAYDIDHTNFPGYYVDYSNLSSKLVQEFNDIYSQKLINAAAASSNQIELLEVIHSNLLFYYLSL